MGLDTGYFRSRPFAVAAVIALLILGGGTAAYTLGGVSTRFAFHDGCTVEPQGEPVEAAPGPVRSREDEGRRQTVAYVYDASGFAGGSLLGCSPLGGILVEPSPDGNVHVEFHIRSDDAALADAAGVRAAFTRDGSGLGIAFWQPMPGGSTGPFGQPSADVATIVRLPGTGAFDVLLSSDVGDVRVSAVLVRNLTLRSDVGDVRALDVDVEGDVDLEADVGDVIASLDSVQSGRIRAVSDVGSVELSLPQRVDIGYDVEAASDVGEVVVRIGETETYTSESEKPGGRVAARSKGYESRQTKVEVVATSDVGSVRVATA